MGGWEAEGEGGGGGAVDLLLTHPLTLLSIVDMHGLLNIKTIQMLRHQRRLNLEALALDRKSGERNMSETRMEELRLANEALQQMWERIEDTHRPVKMFRLLPLTKLNLAKLGAAVAAGLFTTVMRSAIDF